MSDNLTLLIVIFTAMSFVVALIALVVHLIELFLKKKR